jgi:hypothetical protein
LLALVREMALERIFPQIPLGFPLLIVLASEVGNNPGKAAHFHILGLFCFNIYHSNY